MPAFLFPATEAPPACYDGIDDDGDGLVDLDDSECQGASSPSWEGRPCGLGAERAVPLPLLAALGGRARRGVVSQRS